MSWATWLWFGFAIWNLAGWGMALRGWHRSQKLVLECLVQAEQLVDALREREAP